ncbi:MAG: sigma-54-dependent Fis family transcriptional regulator [Ignavibacteria bacterium]|nr:MAG: sigma-54-dependent Fis family transcriptional regulator [Ignavibacteria bacterium]
MAGKPVALILGDDAGIGQCVQTMGFRPIVADLPNHAMEMQRRLSPALVLVNLPNGDLTPRLLRRLSRSGTPLLLMQDEAGPIPGPEGPHPPLCVLKRPVSPGDLRAAVRIVLPLSSPDLPTHTDRTFGKRYLTEYAPLLDYSAKMQAIKEIVEQVADINTTILFRGESGVGKDLVARAVHAASSRADGPFIKVNCAALPGELLESELFGHEKGAFTGAYRRKLGKFEFANEGTIYLDEIGELPLALQAKLLHVVQDLQFSRIGGRELIRVDTRILASTNRNLEVALSHGEFREDLYYRLNVVEIHVPPLRERPEEIPVLASVFLDRFNREYHQNREFLPQTLTLLANCPWPGNVRELENFVRRFVVLGNAERSQQELEAALRTIKRTDSLASPSLAPPTADVTHGLREIARRAARDAERKALKEVLDRVHWNRVAASRILKVSYKTLLNKIVECGLSRKSPHESA